MIHIYNPLQFPYNSNYSTNYLCVMRPLHPISCQKSSLSYVTKTSGSAELLPFSGQESVHDF